MKDQQLSLAQALGDLSGRDPEEVIGLKVVLKYHRRKLGYTHHEIRRGRVIGLSKVPGYIVVEDEKGNKYNRDLSNVWGDNLE